MYLYRDGILKRRVYDSVPLQRLLNEGAITEVVDERICDFAGAGRDSSPADRN
jgi:hypothetical protein